MAGTRYYKLPTGIGKIIVWDGALALDPIASELGGYTTIGFDHGQLTIGDDHYHVGDGFTMTDDVTPVYGGRIPGYQLVRDVLVVDGDTYVDPSNAGVMISHCNGQGVKFHAGILYINGQVVANGDAVVKCGSGIVVIPAATFAAQYDT